MEYLLDGYNILFSSLTKGKTLQQERENFLAELREQNEILQLPLSIVFDAAFMEESFSRQEQRGALQVIYTSHGEIADDFIVREVKHADNPRLITVVTNDNELSFRVRQLGAKTEKVGIFFKKIDKQLKNKEEKKKKQTIDHNPTPLKLLKLHKKRVEKKKKQPDFVEDASVDRYLEIFEKKMKEHPPRTKKGKIKAVEEPSEDDFDRWLRLFSKKEPD